MTGEMAAGNFAHAGADKLNSAASAVSKPVDGVLRQLSKHGESGVVNVVEGHVLGVGHDVVDVAAFTEQLNEPGSRMRGLFSPRELRQASLRARQKNDGEAMHLAVRWAGKEAVLKAWCGALGRRPYPYTVDNFPWSSVEILDDSRGCPHVALAAEVEERLVESLATVGDTGNNGDDGGNGHQKSLSAADTPTPRWLISLTHDGPIASAVVLLVAR